MGEKSVRKTLKRYLRARFEYKLQIKKNNNIKKELEIKETYLYFDNMSSRL